VSVGETVGALLGEADGFGVGLFCLYVGTNVGVTVGVPVMRKAVGVGATEVGVGATEGFALGMGVGTATETKVTVAYWAVYVSVTDEP